MATYKKLLVALDLSSEAKEVVNRAHELSRQSGAEMVLMHVVDSLVTNGDYEMSPELPMEIEQTLVKRAEGYLNSLADDMNLGNVEKRVKVGSVKRKILHYADKHACDLIVIGTHGRHGMATLLGSTANALLHGTKCDVLCVRIGG